jgi:PHD/YefM family antitoxin component YafN of YafNO toxin-antitoxin module
MAMRMSGREFNQDTARAKRAAKRGPVFITDRGRPALVLLTFDAYEELVGARSVLDVLAEPAGVADVEFPVTVSAEVARPATFE